MDMTAAGKPNLADLGCMHRRSRIGLGEVL